MIENGKITPKNNGENETQTTNRNIDRLTKKQREQALFIRFFAFMIVIFVVVVAAILILAG